MIRRSRRARLGADPTSSDPTTLLRALNGLNQHLRRGLTDRAAFEIAETTQKLLDARTVAVTSEQNLVAQAGGEVDWQRQVEEHAATVLERMRTAKPTIYSMSLAGEQVDVAVAVLASDDVPLGTIHAMANPGAQLDIGTFTELTSLIGSQLQLAEIDQSRAYAAEAELRALRAQLSPHFLHNSLTAIAGLVHADPDRARASIAQFSEFLRASFRRQTDLTTVSEELRLVDTYLELAQVRFGDRFNVVLNIAPEALSVPLPVLSLQALVENALRHGLESKPGSGSLRITAEDAGPEISITVEDDGVGIDPEMLQAALRGTDPTTHVGILAIDTRLRSTFGPEYGLTIETAANEGTKITIRLPKNQRG